ncbi:hypothetical protein ACHAWF_011114 [Thalassiosira exigua]
MMNNLRLVATILLWTVPYGMPFQQSLADRSHPSAKVSSVDQALRLRAKSARNSEVLNNVEEDITLVPITSRRHILQLAAKGAASASLMTIGFPGVSLAAVPSPADLKRLQLGHSRVQYLLKNWDKLTETCNNRAMSSTESKQVVRTEGGGGGFCDKTPLVVQEYLGYKSTTDPLFKADSLMLKAVPLVDESVMDEADYVDLVEQYREKADQTSLLAYTSSWGEANPNGGKEAVDDYLDKTKEVVGETEGLLRKVLNALKLEVLEPSAKA